MRSLGFKVGIMPWSDYFPEAAGARLDKSLTFPVFDGRELREHLFSIREQFTRFNLLNRYSMHFAEASPLVAAPGAGQLRG
ncbi:hypothetical protein WG907_17395 [Sphingobium sp. AN558]|uniref:hypothetical protein n=1 Tax=Sphingobium sp. AN558 TaxID=3133442 RepID=UPI0030BE7A95